MKNESTKEYNMHRLLAQVDTCHDDREVHIEVVEENEILEEEKNSTCEYVKEETYEDMSQAVDCKTNKLIPSKAFMAEVMSFKVFVEHQHYRYEVIIAWLSLFIPIYDHSRSFEALY